ncbi:MAG: hypothetical protein SGPRY_002475 [Prymnesium sp.]
MLREAATNTNQGDPLYCAYCEKVPLPGVEIEGSLGGKARRVGVEEEGGQGLELGGALMGVRVVEEVTVVAEAAPGQVAREVVMGMVGVKGEEVEERVATACNPKWQTEKEVEANQSELRDVVTEEVTSLDEHPKAENEEGGAWWVPCSRLPGFEHRVPTGRVIDAAALMEAIVAPSIGAPTIDRQPQCVIPEGHASHSGKCATRFESIRTGLPSESQADDFFTPMEIAGEDSF